MQMIEVRVGYEHEVHGRQVARVQSRLTQTFKHEKPAREIRIDNDVQAANLQKKTGVPDEGEAELTLCNQLRFVNFAGTRCDRGMPYQARELAGSLAESRVFQGRLQHSLNQVSSRVHYGLCWLKSPVKLDARGTV